MVLALHHIQAMMMWLRRSGFSVVMDALVDRGSIFCKKSLGAHNRHRAVVQIFGRNLFKAVGDGAHFEAPY